MKHRKLKPLAKAILYITALLLAGLLLFAGIRFFHKEPVKTAATPSLPHSAENYLVQKPEEKKEDVFDPQWSREDFEHYRSINGDYVCQLRFESGIIDLPVVQTTNNAVYLNVGFETGAYDMLGTTFMDAEATFDSMNITMYGHYCYPEIDPDQVLMFTPLHILKEQENYEANKYIDLLMENEVRRYEVAAVWYCPLNFSPDTQAYDYTDSDKCYYLTEFDHDYFETYRQNVEALQFYDTGVEYSENDHLLTLQTCVNSHDELRLIIIARETERVPVE